MRNLFNRLFNSSASGLYIIVFAISIGVATFIENDFGTSSALKVVYKAWWFETLLVLFSISLLYNIWKFRIVQRKKWPLLIFHAAMVIIIIGAGITRYFSYEGVMHIREGESSNVIFSSESYLNFQANTPENHYKFESPVLFSSLGDNSFNQKYKVGNKEVQVEVLDIIPNPKKSLITVSNGKPIIKIVYGGSGQREEYFVTQGEKKRLFGLMFNFSSEETKPDGIERGISIFYENEELQIKSDVELSQMVMIDQSKSTLEPNQRHPLRLRSMYSNGAQSFVFGDFQPSAEVKLESLKIKMDKSSTVAVLLKVQIEGEEFTRYISGNKGNIGRPELFETQDMAFYVSYGAKRIELPFNLHLRDFIMDRYPGTNSPASYASEVTLNDTRADVQKDYRIFMNNILDYGGYRFFQSSYDNDELGTYLSVNHDFWGTLVTYIGYALFTLGLMMVFVSKNTRFYQLSMNLKKIRDSKTALLVLAFVSCFSFPQSAFASEPIDPIEPTYSVVSEQHAELFNSVVVQDFKGRMKPMHTMSNELLRKVSGKSSFKGYSSSQIILSIYTNKGQWYSIPFIRFNHNEKIADKIGVLSSDMASYKDFFGADGKYKLSGELSRASNMAPADRGLFEKQLLKVDERVNILNMIFSGSLFKIIPLKDDPNNTWVAENSHGNSAKNQDLTVADKFFSTYKIALHDAILTGDYSLSDKILVELKKYQTEVGSAVMPSDFKIKSEIALNNSNVFNRLALFYFLLGMLFLGLLFYTVFNPNVRAYAIHNKLVILVILGFVFHTAGLGIRWYITGRAPWSNGYESMIYIAWTSTLAGLIFTRKSLGGMAATMVLAGAILLIAMLSYLDPEITPLVPVLKSYWLTIHVSLIAGSYGFLMLGAIIGFINLLLFLVMNTKNKKNIILIIKEMSFISEMTLIGGIVMLSIGTYLGGVWANESWGRYWGWDAKETWALVSILVYAFILHMRLIPKMQGLFAFNFATLFGLSSVIMTYYGVNYYLSGMHSYAAGDPVPIPDWVYIAVAFVSVISFFAYLKKRKHFTT